jgi:hypothetical protein
MRYQKFRHKEMLSPFIECYFIWESEDVLEKEMVIETPPNGFCWIVINYGDGYVLQKL